MQPSLLQINFSDGIAKAVCWTLVHSAWEGIAVALLAGGIILCTRKRAAALRYNLLTASLLLFLVAAASTFYYEIVSIPKNISVTPSIEQNIDHVIAAAGRKITGTSVAPPVSIKYYIHRTEGYLNRHAPMITLIWLACMLVHLVRLSGGLYQLGRLRKEGISAPAEWERRLAGLSHGLGIRRSVLLLQSKLVKAPSAVGFLRPTIFLPLGLLTQLSPDQIESILLHELAHIRRSDYLANLLLHITEAVFFFNPGVRWIATLIRREREACCDDMVLAGTPDRHSYFDALVAFMQFTIDGRSLVANAPHTDGRPNGAPAYALQLLGSRKTDLTWRIKRMLTSENKRLHLVEKTVLSLGLLALVSWGTIQASVRHISHHVARVKTHPAIAPVAPSAVDAVLSADAPRVSTAPSSAAAPVITAPVPTATPNQDTTPTRKSGIELISLQTNSTEDKGNKTFYGYGVDVNGGTYELRKTNDKIEELRINGQLIQPDSYSQYADILKMFEEHKGHPGTPGTPGTPSTLGTPSTPGTPDIPATPAAPADAEHGHYSKPPILSNNPITRHIIADLQNDKLIDRLNMLSFSLDMSGMTINGVKQSDEVFKQYKERYLIHPKDHIKYSQHFDGNGSGSDEIVSVDADH